MKPTSKSKITVTHPFTSLKVPLLSFVTLLCGTLAVLAVFGGNCVCDHITGPSPNGCTSYGYPACVSTYDSLGCGIDSCSLIAVRYTCPWGESGYHFLPDCFTADAPGMCGHIFSC